MLRMPHLGFNFPQHGYQKLFRQMNFFVHSAINKVDLFKVPKGRHDLNIFLRFWCLIFELIYFVFHLRIDLNLFYDNKYTFTFIKY